MELKDRQAFYNGFGDGLARAFEFAATPLIFGFLGYVLDRVVGTLPLFLILFSVLCLVGVWVKNMYAYNEAMKEHESAGPWGRSRAAASTPRQES